MQMIRAMLAAQHACGPHVRVLIETLQPQPGWCQRGGRERAWACGGATVLPRHHLQQPRALPPPRPEVSPLRFRLLA